ncbi:MAG: DUF5665 domain-containing protein [bacterium]|nr:DUF5665 domain-containing protein [bacterium]
MEPHERIYRSRKQIIVDNFIGGISWSLGSLIGAFIIIALAGYVLSKIDLIPLIGSFISQIANEAALKNPTLFPK